MMFAVRPSLQTASQIRKFWLTEFLTFITVGDDF
jgi:hypothetical protein